MPASAATCAAGPCPYLCCAIPTPFFQHAPIHEAAQRVLSAEQECAAAYEGRLFSAVAAASVAAASAATSGGSGGAPSGGELPKPRAARRLDLSLQGGGSSSHSQSVGMVSMSVDGGSSRMTIAGGGVAAASSSSGGCSDAAAAGALVRMARGGEEEDDDKENRITHS